MQVDDDDVSTSYTIILQNAETVALISPPGGKNPIPTAFHQLLFRLSSIIFIASYDSWTSKSSHSSELVESRRRSSGANAGRGSSHWYRDTRIHC